MKRSEIKSHLRTARRLFAERGVFLPAWADWGLSEWAGTENGARAEFEGGLGWA